MKHLLLLMTIGLLCCKPTEKSVVGKYNRYWDFENYSSLQLEENNRFTFSGQQGMIFLKSQGKWELERQRLILNSYPDSISDTPSALISEHKTKKDSIYITVLDDQNGELPGVSILIFTNGDTIVKDHTKIDGRAVLKKVDFDSIQLSFVAFNSFIYTGTGNSIIVKMNLAQPDGFRFDNEVWKIKGNKLLDPRFQNDQMKNKYKKVNQQVTTE